MAQNTPQDTMEWLMQFYQKTIDPASKTFANMVNPTEIERRLSELKTVEGWLNFNLSVLQNTIKAFEIQLSILKQINPSQENTANSDTIHSANNIWPTHVMQSASAAFTAAAEAMKKTIQSADKPDSAQDKNS